MGGKNRGTSYYLVAVGTHISGTTEGFKAIDNVVVPDNEPPQIMDENGIFTSGNATAGTDGVTASGTVMITFDKPVYWIASNDTGAVGVPVYNAKSVPTGGNGKVIMDVVGRTGTLELTNETTSPSGAERTFTFTFKDWKYNDSIQFFSGNGRLCDADGNSASMPITVSLRFKTVQQGQLPAINVPYFEASWTDSKGVRHTVEG